MPTEHSRLSILRERLQDPRSEKHQANHFRCLTNNKSKNCTLQAPDTGTKLLLNWEFQTIQNVFAKTKHKTFGIEEKKKYYGTQQRVALQCFCAQTSMPQFQTFFPARNTSKVNTFHILPLSGLLLAKKVISKC